MPSGLNHEGDEVHIVAIARVPTLTSAAAKDPLANAHLRLPIQGMLQIAE